ncbi:MAG TPA: aldehyde dehydrogenase family protein [Polyangia bacterium]|jgi:acyl-CoA reductase-like NAD-dependent aldehyde dehydrogenase|nr:aldehyde dehydrogenase family protein [Polyangia bacterium]
MEIHLVSPEATRLAPPSSERTTIPCFDPATLEPLGEVPAMSGEEVRARVVRARRAQAAWQKTSFAERRRVLGLLLEYLLDHADELCNVIARDAGKTRENALLGELWPVAEKLRHTIATGERDLAPERVPSGLLLHKVATIEFQPIGVIGVICPWNFPLQNILGPTIPALMAGNAVLVKVSEWTSWSAPRFQAMLDEVLRQAGHSPDLVQILTGYGETGAALVRAPVDKIIFTGSVGNGRRVLATAAETLTPVILELGGKDPFIVCEDANLDKAVASAMQGVFIASGQMCLAAERLYVHRAVYDVFVDQVVHKARELRQGAPLAGGVIDVGAMTMPQQVDIVERLVADAVRKGACVRTGGRRCEQGGQFYEPTVLTGVTHDMEIMREETFGPVMCIMRVNSDEEAIRLANDSHFGLGGTIITKSNERARRIAREIIAGQVCINDFGLPYMVNSLPFGGVRNSGFGRLNGREGIRACTNMKSVLTDRFPIPGAAHFFPVSQDTFEGARAAIELIYRRRWRDRARAVMDLVQGVGQQLLGRN